MHQRISIGFATLLGTLGAVAAVLTPMIGELADAAQPLGVSPQVWVIVSAVLATAVVIGRMAQAAAAAAAGTRPVDDSDPEALIDEPPVERLDANPPA